MSSLCQRLFITPKYKHTNYKFRNPRACRELQRYINEHTSVQSQFKEVNWKRRHDGEEGVDYILSQPPTSPPITPSILTTIPISSRWKSGSKWDMDGDLISYKIALIVMLIHNNSHNYHNEFIRSRLHFTGWFITVVSGNFDTFLIEKLLWLIVISY